MKGKVQGRKEVLGIPARACALMLLPQSRRQVLPNLVCQQTLSPSDGLKHLFQQRQTLTKIESGDLTKAAEMTTDQTNSTSASESLTLAQYHFP